MARWGLSRQLTISLPDGAVGQVNKTGVGYCQFSEGVISDTEPEEVARRHHLAELEKMDSYSQKGRWDD